MFFRYNLPALVWATVILLLTLLPAARMPEVPDWQLISFATASHAVVFFIFTFLLRGGFYLQRTFLNLRRQSGFYALVFSVLFGALIEYLQSTLGWGRQGDVMDILSNSIGSFIAMFAFTLVLRYRLLGNLM